jgi:hypothetical protein
MLRFGPGTGLPADVTGVPFAWLGAKLSQVVAASPPGLSIELWASLSVLLAVASTVAFPAWRAKTATERTLLLFALLAALLGWKVYVEAFASARALVVIPPLAVLVAARGPGRWRRLGLGAAAACSVIAGVLLVRQVVWEARVPAVPIRIAVAAGGRERAPDNRAPAGVSGGGVTGEGVLLLEPFVHDPPGLPTDRRTDLELRAGAAEPASVFFELLRTDGRPYPWPCRMRLAPGQPLLLEDAVQRLFGSSGAFVLRARCESGAVAIRYRIRDLRRDRPEWEWSTEYRLEVPD